MRPQRERQGEGKDSLTPQAESSSPGISGQQRLGAQTEIAEAEALTHRASKGSRSQSSLGLDAVTTTLALVLVALLFQTYAPEPYMAEWNPKITTFPGLYLVGAASGRFQHELLKFLLPNSKLAQAEMCGTATLRFTNIGLGTLCFVFAHKLYLQLHPEQSTEFATQMALLIILLPTHFLYTFLYYTDVGSLAAVLASLLAALDQKYLLSGLAAAAAVMFRQTNAVWAVFVTMVAVLRRFPKRTQAQLQQTSFSRQIVITLKLCWMARSQLTEMWPLLAVPVAFAAFAVWNGGIVVGDRSHHTPVLHFAQPLYCLLFATACLPHVHFQPLRMKTAFWSVTQAYRRKPAVVLKSLGMAFTAVGYLVQNFTLVHPFLLADNRHYVFYIWKDLIAPYPAARFLLVPAYLYSGWSLWRCLKDAGQPDIFVAGLMACMAVTLVPAWLLELRYFTIPVVLVLVYMRPLSGGQLLQAQAIFVAVNAVTIYVFLFRPYKWVDGSTARFMW